MQANGALTLLAGEGVIILDDLMGSWSARKNPIVIDADTEKSKKGSLIVSDKAIVSTNHSVLNITTFDIELQGTLSTGNASLAIHASTSGQGIGLGVTPDEATDEDMQLNNEELGNITTGGGMSLQCAPGGHISVNGVGVNSSAGIRGGVYFLGRGETSEIKFNRASSFFSAASIRADGGIQVLGNLTATDGDILLEREVVDSSVMRTSPIAIFGDAVFIRADGKVRLGHMNDTGMMRMKGALSMEAGGDLDVHQDLVTEGRGGKILVLHADTKKKGDATQDGRLRIHEGVTVRTGGGPVNITAFDLELTGKIVAGGSKITVTGSVDGQIIGVGAEDSERPKITKEIRTENSYQRSVTPVGLHLSDAELGRLRSELALEIGSATTGDIHVVGVTEENTENCGALNLIASRDKATVTFSQNASSFSKGINVLADAGVEVQEELSTKDTPTSLSAGTGTLTVTQKGSMTTNGQLLTITTDNVDLQGSAISSGDAITVMSCATTGRGVGLGDKDPEHGQLLISGTEMQTLHSGGLILGGNCGSLVVAGVKEKHSNNVRGVVRLLATSLHKKIIDEETSKYYPDNVIIEKPEDAMIASVEVESQNQPTSIEHVPEKETLNVQGDTGVVEEAALARQDTVQEALYATADHESSIPG